MHEHNASAASAGMEERLILTSFASANPTRIDIVFALRRRNGRFAGSGRRGHLGGDIMNAIQPDVPYDRSRQEADRDPV